MLKNGVMWVIARVWLQPLWRALHKLSLAGMNYMNDDDRLNGERRMIGELLRGKATPVVLDVGANEGSFVVSIKAANPAAVVHAFEPNPPTFARLKTRLGESKDVVLNNVGVGEVAGTLEIFDYVNASPQGMGSAHASFLKSTFEDIYVQPHQAVKVPVVTLDDYAKTHKLKHIDLLVIDTEGYELKVLEGAAGLLKRGAVGAVQLEFNAHHIMAGSSIWKLSKVLAGYDLYRLHPDGMVPLVTADVPYNSRVEIFKYCNVVALRRAT